MADYPKFAQVIGSRRQSIDDMQIDQDQDGNVRARAFFSERRVRLILSHKLTEDEVETLMAFYDSERTNPLGFNVQWKCNGPVYVAIFEGVPELSEDNPLTTATVNLRVI